MEEDDIKLALRNIAAANLSLCNQLISLNASPTTIAQNALGGFIEDGDVEEYVNRVTTENERLKLGIAQLKELDLDMTYNCSIYFFSQVRGVVTTSPRKLLNIDSIYDGEAIVTDIEQIIPELLLPLLYDSLKAADIDLCKRINDAIAEVLTMLDIQKDGKND